MKDGFSFSPDSPQSLAWATAQECMFWRETVGRVLAASILCLMLVAASVATFTGATFTGTQWVRSNPINASSVDTSASPASAVVTFGEMAPGDKVTAPITVSNAGSLQLRHATSETTENTLAEQLDMTIKRGVTKCTNRGFAIDGTVLYGPNDFGRTGGLNVFGDPTRGSQVGVRTLNANVSEVLCIQVSLPLATATSFQSLTTTATFDFVAEQTATN
jgi:hypothetical protein